MKTYLVALVRTYGVTIEAENEEEAMRCAEFFIGDCEDVSNARDRKEYNFSINEIKPCYNEAADVEEVED
ncbi:MAG: hypothetical protein ACR2NQ_02450 [Thermodesulfobacteriota bacterium]